MLRKITFLCRRDMMRVVFNYLKTHPVEESTNLNFVSPEERIGSSRQKSHRCGVQLNLRKTVLMAKGAQQRKGPLKW